MRKIKRTDTKPNKQQPTPGQILSDFFHPVDTWVYVIGISFLWITMVSGYIFLTTTSYSLYTIPLSAFILIVAVLLQRKEAQLTVLSGSQPDARKYAVNASRIGIISLIGGFLAVLSIPIVHVFEETSVEPTTRLVFVSILAFILLFSYIVSRSILTIGTSLPIRLTTLLVLMTVIVVIIPVFLVVYTGFIYDDPAPYTIDAQFTLVDSLSISLALYGLYFSLITRL